MTRPEKKHIAIDYGVTAHVGIDPDTNALGMKFQDLATGTFEVEIFDPTTGLLLADAIVKWAEWMKTREH